MAESNKFFFRTETLGNDPEAYIDVSDDMAWSVNDGEKKAIRRTAPGASGQGGMSAGGAAGDGSDMSAAFDPFPYPNTKIDTPIILGIVRQEVSQDPEGKGTIDVTFSVKDTTKTDVEWEIRITR